MLGYLKVDLNQVRSSDVIPIHSHSIFLQTSLSGVHLPLTHLWALSRSVHPLTMRLDSKQPTRREVNVGRKNAVDAHAAQFVPKQKQRLPT